MPPIRPWIAGDVYRLPLTPHWDTILQLLDEPYAVFLNVKVEASRPFAAVQIQGCDIYRVLAVSATARKEWSLIGPAPVKGCSIPAFFTKTPEGDLKIWNRGKARRATRSECAGLDQMAHYSHEYLERRLRDHLLRGTYTPPPHAIP